MLLTKDEECQLSHRIQSGCIESRNELVDRNYGLVCSIAKKFKGRGLDIEDLISEGNLGLIRACKTFNPEKFDSTFSTYATHWIKQFIRVEITKNSRTIRVPSWACDKIKEWNQSEEVMMHEAGRKVNDDEIADEIELTEDQRSVITPSVNRQCQSILRRKFNGNDEDYDFEHIGKEDEIDLDNTDGVNTDRVLECLHDLDDKSREIIILRHGFYGETKTLKELGEMFGCSRERIRQIQKQAQEKIRKSIGQLELSC